MITLTSRALRRFAPLLKNYNCRSSTNLAPDDEYTSEPQYPEILDMSYKARNRRRDLAWYEEVKNVKTVEEKLIKINMPRYYGFRTMIIHEDFFPFDPLPFIKNCTRTHFICQDSLPDHYLATQPAAENIVAQIRDSIESCLVLEQDIKRNVTTDNEKSIEEQLEDARTYHIVTQFNRIIMNTLVHSLPHLSTVQVDHKPRHEYAWHVGGMENTHHIKRSRSGSKGLTDEQINQPVDRAFQFLGRPLLVVRSSLPLEPLLPYSDAENVDYVVPKYIYSPETAGYEKKYRHLTNIPGFWPGDVDEFGLLCYRGRGYQLSRNKSFGEEDNIDALHSQGIASCYGWLLSQACYQGFSPYNDVTYPTVAQMVITNGQYWSFYSYQMNTALLHRHFIDENPKHNICYGTKPLKLYESIENGKVIGFNDNVLKMLIQFYANEPKERINTNLKPYLGENEKVIADIEHVERREWLEKHFKHLFANRPRHRLMYEVYHWEKFYKIDHKTRPVDAKKRPFELHLNPYARRLDEHVPKYIPKSLRPPKEKKVKFEKTYYP